MGLARSLWKGWPSPHRGNSTLGQARNRRLDDRGQDRGRPPAAAALQEREVDWRRVGRLGDLVGRRAIGKGDWDRALRRPRPAPDLREALSQERRRSGTDQVSAWAQL